MLWQDPDRAVQTEKPTNLFFIKAEEWIKIP